MNKQECRSYFKAKRISLSDEEILELNAQLLEQMKKFDWTGYSRIHVFLSISKFKEPDTLEFISWIKKIKPYVALVISKSDFISGTMTNYLYDENIVLQTNSWGIPEPADGISVDDKSIDIVIVPMLVCDQTGNRVGFGKGFYDRFLAGCRADVVTVGLSFFKPIDNLSDVDEWDYPLDYCITPNGLYSFNKKGS